MGGLGGKGKESRGKERKKREGDCVMCCVQWWCCGGPEI